MQNVLKQTFALVQYNSVFVPLCSPNTCKGVFNPNVTTFQSNCVYFSAFHFITASVNSQATVLNLDHYLLQLSNKLDIVNSKLDTFDTLSEIFSQHKQQTMYELSQIMSKLNELSTTVTHLSSDDQQIEQISAHLSRYEEQTAAELAQIKSKLDGLTATSNHLVTQNQEITTKISESKQQTSDKIAQIRSMLDELKNSANHLAIDHQKIETISLSLSEHKEQMSVEIAQISSTLGTLTSSTAQLSTDHQRIEATTPNVECVGTEEHLQMQQKLLENITHQIETIKANKTITGEERSCGGTGWRRVAFLNMTNPSTTCPSGWQLTGYAKRTCGRVSTQGRTCSSVTLPVTGGQYHKVCGRIKAYQYKSTLAFYSYHNGYAQTIDTAYVDGVSLTHGNPRKHIWTFASGVSEGYASVSICPCDAQQTLSLPSFMGEEYFCETGVNEKWIAGHPGYAGFNVYDPLWDGNGCTTSGACCSLHNPPYFMKELLVPTTDDIEARICLYHYFSVSNIAVEEVELYVQ